MQRTVTVIYRTYDVANLVRDEIERLGIAQHQVLVLPNIRVVPDTTDPSNSTTMKKESLDHAFEQLHDLHLPESDTRTYQQALRNGDFVVSVNLDDDADLARVEQVMRRPEDAHRLDELDTTYSSADFEPRRQPPGEGFDEGMAGRRDGDQLSPYTRSYRRDVPLLVPAIAVAPIGTR